uniref:Essential protein Yae1 N-terminal domain-containing protein n=1 Tax=Cucumis melo TaxID=3656 RepID=A0A1S4DX60_CUCME
MEGTIAEELYSESLQSTKSKLGDISLSDYKKDRPSGSGVDDSCKDDGSLWGGSDEGLEETADLDREWQRRHDQFHTIGYRDGLIAGKEAAAQEGFNIGFKQSVSVGYKLGLVRGVSSVLASLPDDLKEKLAGTPENQSKFQSLYESVNSLSTVDALRLFNGDITTQHTKEEFVSANTNSQTMDLLKKNPDYGRLGKFYEELAAHLPQSPALNVHLHEER